jgi:large subunit ribosomal protein L1
MRKRSKRYSKASEDQNGKGPLALGEAVSKVKGWADTKFDQSVECVAVLGIDARQADQIVRGAITLPHGIGKTLRVIAFCEGDDATAAKEAGASEAGGDELVEKVSGGWLDFDVAVAHPKLMGKVGKLGRVLGPQGKMPSPKNGTVTPKVAETVRDYAAGKVDFRNDSGGNVHAVIGKISFENAKLEENASMFLDTIKKMKPTGAKGTYLKNFYMSATMSPSVEVSLA